MIKYLGFSALIPIIVTVLEFVVSEITFLPKILRNSIGQDSCWFFSDEKLVEALHLYVPVSLLLITGIIFYTKVGRKLYVIDQKTWRNEKTLEKLRCEFILYFRFFIVLGLTWSLEIIFWLCNHSIFYNLSEIVTILNIFVILSLFKWKPKIKELQRSVTE